MTGILRIATMCLLALSAMSCSRKAPNDNIVTGLVDATEVDIASKVPGRIDELFVTEGQTVRRGDKLVRLRSEEILAKFAQATAASQAAQAKLSLARHGARPAERAAVERELDAAKAQAELAQKTFDRTAELLGSGTIPQAKYDEAKLRLDVAKEQVSMVEAKQTIVKDGARSEELQALTALVEQSRGVIAEIQAYEAETEQKAPIDGEVSKIVLQPGELAGTGSAILTLVKTQEPWVSFAVREDLLAKIRQGTEIVAEIPALKKTERFTVFQIAPLGDFATWKATTQKNGFDLKSFEVKARPATKIDGLRPGMTVRWNLG